MTGLIKGISFAVGTVHDFQMFKNQSVEMAKDITILADLGFLGIQKIHENSIIPHKKSKLKPLTEQQKDENKKQASKRVMIEHINRDCKIFRICSSKYRGKHKNYDKNWRLITAIVNLKRTTRNLKMTDFN